MTGPNQNMVATVTFDNVMPGHAGVPSGPRIAVVVPLNFPDFTEETRELVIRFPSHRRWPTTPPVWCCSAAAMSTQTSPVIGVRCRISMASNAVATSGHWR